MKQNMGSTDKIIRVLIAVLIGILFFTKQISGGTALVLGIVAGIMLLTSLVGTCPLYLPFGINTKKRKTHV